MKSETVQSKHQTTDWMRPQADSVRVSVSVRETLTHKNDSLEICSRGFIWPLAWELGWQEWKSNMAELQALNHHLPLRSKHMGSAIHFSPHLLGLIKIIFNLVCIPGSVTYWLSDVNHPPFSLLYSATTLCTSSFFTLCATSFQDRVAKAAHSPLGGIISGFQAQYGAPAAAKDILVVSSEPSRWLTIYRCTFMWLVVWQLMDGAA